MLLNPRHIKAVLPFTSKDETRAILTGVRITSERIEATDSYRLARITPKNSITADDFPRFPDGSVATGTISEHGITVDAKALKRSLGNVPRSRRSLPVLNRIAVKPSGNHVLLTTTDLSLTSSETSRLIDGSFPDIDKLLPSEQPVSTITFNAEFLKQVAKAFQDFGGRHAIVTVDVFSELKPARFSATDEDGTEMVAILMPVRKG